MVSRFRTPHAPTQTDRAAWILDYLAVKDAVERLRLNAEDVLGEDAHDAINALERVEDILRAEQPRLSSNVLA